MICLYTLVASASIFVPNIKGTGLKMESTLICHTSSKLDIVASKKPSSKDEGLIRNFQFLGLVQYLSNRYFSAFDQSIYDENVIVCNLIWIICTGVWVLLKLQLIIWVHFKPPFLLIISLMPTSHTQYICQRNECKQDSQHNEKSKFILYRPFW